jgi:hypothetical protein
MPVFLVMAAIYCGIGTAHACYLFTVSANPTVTAKGGTTSTITAHVTVNGSPPSPSHTIQFTVAGPAGGSVSSPHETDSNGDAIATYTSGSGVGTATITATDLDQAGQPTRQCSITVYTINCIKIEATNDVDIYWPNPTDGEGTTSNVIWKANQSTFETNGTIVETCTRKALADIFQPTAQHYTLTFTLDRYPACSTNQTPTTYFTYGDPNSATGWTPAFSVADESSVAYISYDAALTFKVDNITVDTQIIGGIEEFDIWGTYTCDVSYFTKDHLEYACTWGSGGTTQPTTAHNVMVNINGAITSSPPGNICPGEFSTAWDDHCWLDATPDGNSSGMCCCRAHGMMLATQLLGLKYSEAYPKYTHVYVNERSEANNTSGTNPTSSVHCAGCDKDCFRGAWWGGFWNSWEGAARSGGAGTTCYAPAGEFEGTYDSIRSQFGPYYWSWGGTSESNKCPGGAGHLSAPTLPYEN